ncbi:MAG: peroxiredoxin [Puniceicoccaceae bacterium]|nr:MAG: peroxiredoxin [Puniceicoccaceae bacterium]
MKMLFKTLMVFSLFQSFLHAAPLAIGSPAPQVQAVIDDGTSIDFGEALATGTTLVFFYPKAMTPGCTRQACSLRDAWDELSARDVRIFGVSSDAAETQAAFREKHNLPFTLLADTEGALADAFGKGRWSRQAYIFRDGVLIWRDLKASTSDQAADVLAALDKL